MVLYSHDQLYKHIYMQNHNDDTIKTSGHSSLEKYTSHFIWKGCVWEGVEDRTDLQHIDPHSIGHNCVSFPFSWTTQPGAWGPSLSGICSSIQHLISNCNCSIRGLRAYSAGCWLSLPHLVSNSSDPQLINWGPEDSLCWVLAFSTASCLQLVWSPTDWISCALSYIIVQHPPSSCGRPIFTLIQPVHGQGYNILIFLDQMHTGAFPILTAQPGRRSIYNNGQCVTTYHQVQNWFSKFWHWGMNSS